MFWRKHTHNNGHTNGHEAATPRTSQEIWLVGTDAALIDAVTATLRAHQPTAIATHPTLDDLLLALGVQTPLLVIVDLDPQPMLQLAQLEPIIARVPGTRFIAVAHEVTASTLTEAMHVGVRQLIARSALSRELEPAYRRVVAHGAMGSVSHGSIITVLSAAGGCGATTLAVNLARELPRGGNEPALLIDLDSAYGCVATYLGLEGAYGLADVLAAPNIDPQLVASTALKFDEYLHALLNPVSMSLRQPATLQYENLEASLEACRMAYPWVVADAPRLPLDIAARLALRSRCTFIVAQMLLKDLRTARTMLQGLLERGVREQTVRYVINRYHSRRGLLSLDDAQRALGASDVVLINNDFRSANESLSLGQPLAVCAPRSAPRRDIAALAQTCVQARSNSQLLPTIHTAAAIG